MRNEHRSATQQFQRMSTSAGNEYEHLLMREHRDEDIPNSITKDENILRDGISERHHSENAIYGEGLSSTTCRTATA